MRLGLLDFGDLELQELLAHAQLADRLGYSRLWLAEHVEPLAMYANATIMTTIVAGTTDRIRVGPAGVLLRFQAPYAAVDSALLLERLFPGRIDFGLAGGTARPDIAALLADGRSGVETPEYFERKVEAVLAIARERVASEVDAARRTLPPFWVLGSSGRSAALAGSVGAAYSLSLFHRDPPPGPEALTAYRDELARRGFTTPMLSVAVAVACLDGGATHGFPPANPLIRNVISGRLAECEERVRELAHRYAVDEIIVLDCHRDGGRRSDAITALAERFGLEAS